MDVGVGELGLDTLQNPVERRRIRNVDVLRLAGTAGQEATNAPLAVNIE